MSRGWVKASACRLQIILSCAVLCHIVSLQYLSRSSLHRLAGLPCLFFSYGLQLSGDIRGQSVVFETVDMPCPGPFQFSHIADYVYYFCPLHAVRRLFKCHVMLFSGNLKSHPLVTLHNAGPTPLKFWSLLHYETLSARWHVKNFTARINFLNIGREIMAWMCVVGFLINTECCFVNSDLNRLHEKRYGNRYCGLVG